MVFGNRLRELREVAGWSQEELGQRVNLKKSNISKYERGALEPSHDTLILFSELFKVTTDYLLGRTDHRQHVKVPLATFAEYLPLDLQQYVLAHKDTSWAELTREMSEQELRPEDVKDLLRMVRQMKDRSDELHKSKLVE